jgi:gliding motility-associated lipoprotein GldH
LLSLVVENFVLLSYQTKENIRMKTLKPILILSLVFIIFSCNENRVFKEYSGEFANYRWQKDNVVAFSPEINDTDQEYNIYFTFRHVYGFQLMDLKINVEMISPSGKTKKKNYKLKIFKNKSEYYSDCAGDYCDLDTLIEEEFKFKETGKYTFKISYDEKVDMIPNVMEVGLIIDKVGENQEE